VTEWTLHNISFWPPYKVCEGGFIQWCDTYACFTKVYEMSSWYIGTKSSQWYPQCSLCIFNQHYENTRLKKLHEIVRSYRAKELIPGKKIMDMTQAKIPSTLLAAIHQIINRGNKRTDGHGPKVTCIHYAGYYEVYKRCCEWDGRWQQRLAWNAGLPWTASLVHESKIEKHPVLDLLPIPSPHSERFLFLWNSCRNQSKYGNPQTSLPFFEAFPRTGA